MRTLVPSVCSLILLTLVVAAVPRPGAGETAYGGRISGKVVSPDGKPVPDASVCIVVNAFSPKEFAEHQVKTRADGTFAFRPLEERQYAALVFAVKPGYGAASLPIEERKDRTGLTLKLRSGAPIDAQITDSTGAPISGATVRLLKGTWSHGVSIAYFDCLAARSGPDGKVRIPWLATADTARIDVEHPQYGRYGGVASAPAGKLDIRLYRSAQITGRVLHSGTHKPEQFVEVGCQRVAEWEQGLDTGYSTTFPNAQGEFKLENLQPGDYIVWTRDLETRAKWISQRVMINGLREGGSAKCPDLELISGAVVTGKVVDTRSGKGIEFAEVRAQSEAGDRWNRTFTATAYGDGTFSLRVPPGKWTLAPDVVAGYLPGAPLPAREFKEGEQVAEVVLKLDPSRPRRSK